MNTKYKIIGIVHSGTKGERSTPVTANKYDDIVGCKVFFNPDNIHIGYGLTMQFPPDEHPLYDWWTISCIQKAFREQDILIIETMNSIYYLKYLGECVYITGKDNND